ncbi:MAG: hypothetical protein ACRCWS_04585, partial [Propionibacteriaceae bacterium]
MLYSHLELFGHATTTELLIRDGISPRDIQRYVRDGELIRAHRGAYFAPAEQPTTTHARFAIATARALPLPYALSDQSALTAWGIPLARTELRRLHLTLPPGHRPDSQSKIAVLHTPPAPGTLLRLPAPWDDVFAVSPAVACCQVAIRCGLPSGLVPADYCLHEKLFTADDLAEASNSTGLVRHVKRAQQLLALCDSLSESVGETLLRWELRQVGIYPQSQVAIYDDEGFVGRVDFLNDRTVIEFDGAVKYAHAQGRDALVQEKRREDRLRRAGYTVVRVT